MKVTIAHYSAILIFLLFLFTLSIVQSVNAQEVPIATQKNVVENFKVDLAQYTVFGTDCSFKNKGDANCDGNINQFDLAIWETEFNSADNQGRADFNSDGKVDLLDFGIWKVTFHPVTLSKESSSSFLSSIYNSIISKLASFTSTVYAQESQANTTPLTASSAFVSNAGNSFISNLNGQNTQYVTMDAKATPINSHYFDSNGNLLAEVDFSPTSGTIINTNVNGVDVSTNKTVGGAIIENYKNSSGSMIALKSWPTADSYQKSEPPQAVTLPGLNNDSFLTVSIQPNSGTILQEIDRNGNVVNTSSISDKGFYNSFDPQSKSHTQSFDQAGIITVSMDNNLGGKTKYSLLDKVILNITQTDSNKNTWIATPKGGYDNWELIKVNSNPEERSFVPDPIAALKSDTPSPTKLIATWNYYVDTAETINPEIDYNAGFNSSLPALSKQLDVANQVYKNTRTPTPPDVLGISFIKEAYAQTSEQKPGDPDQKAAHANGSVTVVGVGLGSEQNGSVVTNVVTMTTYSGPGATQAGATVSFEVPTTTSVPGFNNGAAAVDWAQNQMRDEKVADTVKVNGEAAAPAQANSAINPTSAAPPAAAPPAGAPADPAAKPAEPAAGAGAGNAPGAPAAAAAATKDTKEGTADERGLSVVTDIARQGAAAGWDEKQIADTINAARDIGKEQGFSIPQGTAIQDAVRDAYVGPNAVPNAQVPAGYTMGRNGPQKQVDGETRSLGNLANHGSRDASTSDPTRQPSVQPPPPTTAPPAGAPGVGRQENGLPPGVGTGTYPGANASLPSSYAGVNGTTTRTDKDDGSITVTSKYDGLADHTINIAPDGSITESWSRPDGSSVSMKGDGGGNTTISEVTTAAGTISVTDGIATVTQGDLSLEQARDTLNQEIANRNEACGCITENDYGIGTDANGNQVLGNTSAASGMPSCFLAGTLISTLNGFIPIEKLRPGDKVYSYNEKTGRKEVADFVELDINFVEEYLIINNKINASIYHPFYKVTKNGLETVRADELIIGDILQSEEGSFVPVSSIEHVPAPKTTVYNLLGVTPHNNFYAEGILVHNYPGPDNMDYSSTVDSFDGSGSGSTEPSSEDGGGGEQGAGDGGDQGGTQDSSGADGSTSQDGTSDGGGNQGNSSND